MITIDPRLIRLILTGFLMAGFTTCFPQKPSIHQVDKVSGANGDVITIQGIFVNDPARTIASFGAVRGDVRFLSDQLMEVGVPAGATYENIVVTDIVSGLSDEAPRPFLLSFGGNHGITGASLEGQHDVNSESGLYDLCMCDFDGDNRTDIATANDGANSMNILANTTPLAGLANISFNRIPFLIGARSIHATCGDLNNDGKPDLIVSEGANGDRLFIFRNTSTGPGAFTFSIQSVALTGVKVKRTAISDLDGDGKPEVIVTNQTGGTFTILANESTTANIIFSASRITITLDGAASTDGLAVEDLDGDGLPEIVTSQFLTQTSNIFILKNASIPGNISFIVDQTLSISGTVVNIKAGDLDGDDKPEITATQLIGPGTVSIFRNLTTGAISFAAPVTFATDVRPWGLDFGDIDGDGLTDIVVASLEKSVSVLNNESTGSGLAFSTLVQSTTYINRHVAVGDVDGDGKPDIAFTSVDDNNNNIPASKISILRNKNCLVPLIDPAGPISMCTGFPLRLNTTPSNGTTYEWKDGSSALVSGPAAYFDVAAGGAYNVTAIGEGGACAETSNTVTVTVDPGTTTGTASPAGNDPVCPGSTLTLTVNDVGGTAYNWTGPDGYTGTGLTPAPITDFQPANAGRYYLDVVVNGCIAQQASIVVEMISVPDFQITYSGTEVICSPDTKTLSIVPNAPDFTYQWAERTTGDIGGAIGNTFAATSSGRYYVKAQSIPNPACAAIETQEVGITFSTAPVADFTAPSLACTGQAINFTNQSAGNAAATMFYNWSFGDTQTSADENPVHQYSNASTFSVTLSVSYNDGACENLVTKDITIQTSPPVSITTPGNIFSVCSGDSLALALSGAFSSYLWSTNETTPSVYVRRPGIYWVDVTSGSCVITASVTVDSLASPVVTANADPAQVNEGASAQLTASGLTTFAWDPSETLSDPSIANPVATPLTTTIYTIRGTDDNGCSGMATVEVSVKGDLVVNKLRPSKFISPDNGDAINNFWIVEGILDYPQCGIAIYDDKGIKVYEARPYNNDWEGTYRGNRLPDGVYYYIIRCDGEENSPKTGSITVLR